MAESPLRLREAPRGLVSPRPVAGDGSIRWYAAYAGEGHEDALAARLRSVLPREVLDDAFCPRWEVVMKRRGAWLKTERTMFPGYVLLASADDAALSRALSRLSFPVPMAGRRGRALSPMEAETQKWLERTLDERRVLRASEGFIRSGKLTVERGPLRGSEPRVRRIDRHKSMAWIDLGVDSSRLLLRAALAVPRKE